MGMNFLIQTTYINIWMKGKPVTFDFVFIDTIGIRISTDYYYIQTLVGKSKNIDIDPEEIYRNATWAKALYPKATNFAP